MQKKFSWNKVALVIYFSSAVYFLTAIFTNDPIKLGLGIFLGTSTYFYLIFLIWSRRRFKPFGGYCVIEMQDEAVFCRYSNGTVHSMLWRDVQRITVHAVASDDIVVSSELWLRLYSYPWRQVLSIPWRAEGFSDFYERISNWNGFKSDIIDEAMTKSGNVSFNIWEKREE